MGRRAKPWRRGGDGGPWYATVGGKQRIVAEAGADYDEALGAMVALRNGLKRELAEGGGRPRPTVAALVADFLAACVGQVRRDELSEETLRFYRDSLRLAVPEFGALKAEALRPFHVNAWLDRHPQWNSTTRACYVTAVKRVFRWAKAEGKLDANPIADLRKPTPLKRETVPSTGRTREALATVLSPEFALLLRVIFETGCRPGEARRMEAKDLDLARRLYVRPGKTTRRTGMKRQVVLTEAVAGLLGPLAQKYPAGPILRNTKGEPWTQSAVNTQMRRLRGRLRRAGKDTPELVPYALRHVFATDALDKGVPVATVATLLGQKGTKILMERYSHLADRHDHLRDALDQIRGGESTPDPDAAD